MCQSHWQSGAYNVITMVDGCLDILQRMQIRHVCFISTRPSLLFSAGPLTPTSVPASSQLLHLSHCETLKLEEETERFHPYFTMLSPLMGSIPDTGPSSSLSCHMLWWCEVSCLSVRLGRECTGSFFFFFFLHRQGFLQIGIQPQCWSHTRVTVSLNCVGLTQDQIKWLVAECWWLTLHLWPLVATDGPIGHLAAVCLPPCMKANDTVTIFRTVNLGCCYWHAWVMYSIQTVEVGE